MSYPLSAAVAAGDPTLASHYNNLRSDALHLGQAAANAVNLAALLERYESRLKIARLNTTQLRIAATASAPVALMVAGYMCQAVVNIDLALADAPSGPAADYYVYANRVADSTTFTLSVSTSSVEGADQRRIGAFYWNGSTIEKDSIVTELAQLVTDILQFKESHVCEGRLTLSTGVAVPNADIVSSSLVFFTPYGGNRIALYVPGYGWRHYTFAELSIDISACADATNYDVFVYDNAGTLTLSATAWSNATLRATSLTVQDGVLCKSGALNYRYLGTFHTFTAGATRDTAQYRLLYNHYNRVLRRLYVKETNDTASWTQAAAGTLYWNNDPTNKIEVCLGLDECLVSLFFTCHTTHSTTGVTYIGFGIDSIAAVRSIGNRAYNTAPQNLEALYLGHPGLGYHDIYLLQYTSAGSATFYGTWATMCTLGAIGWIFS